LKIAAHVLGGRFGDVASYSREVSGKIAEIASVCRQRVFIRTAFGREHVEE
jgi:hypothetical protein